MSQNSIEQETASKVNQQRNCFSLRGDENAIVWGITSDLSWTLP